MPRRYLVKRTFISAGGMVINSGTVIEPPGLYRDYLLSRGLIELDVPDEPTAEVLTMAIEPELNMAIEPKKRRRGRPPKVRP